MRHRIRVALLALSVVTIMTVGTGVIAVSLLVRQARRMPDMEKYEVVLAQFGMCASGPFLVRFFNLKGTDNTLGELAAYYDRPDDTRPMVVVVFETDAGTLREILLDRDKDGTIDARGKAGDPAFGEGFCDVVDRTRVNAPRKGSA